MAAGFEDDGVVIGDDFQDDTAPASAPARDPEQAPGLEPGSEGAAAREPTAASWPGPDQGPLAELEARSDPGVVAEPAGAAEVFGDRIGAARTYALLVASAGVERGLIGPREASRLWTRHILNCAAMAELIPEGARVVDIGSGAGLPGIPLALARPDLHVDLVESLKRRTTFLQEAVGGLGLADRCRVIRARAEEAGPQVGGADVVTARAVAPLGRLCEWAAPLLRPGGLLLALKGETAGDEVRRDRAAVRRSGITDLDVVRVGAEVPGGPVTVVKGRRVVGRVGGAESKAPRASGRRGTRGRGVR